MVFNQNISYYSHDGESFADVQLEEYVFNCRVSNMENDGDAIILLHGFPETSRMWTRFITELDHKAFRVVAPDQRGYSKGARPSIISEYTIDKLSEDIINIADAFQFDKFHLVGHDWGSAVGWYTVANHLDRVISWTALSVPHLDAFFEAFNMDAEQQRKSRYISFFKKSLIPEIYFTIFRNKYLKDIWRESSSIEIEKYLEVLSQRGAIKAALNWYRANMHENYTEIGEILTPTLILYGKRDMAIGERSVDQSEKYLKGSYTIKKLDAGHWLIQEAFDEISKSILEHIDAN